MESPVLEDLIRLGAVLLLVAANAFFVAAEFALVSARATRLEAMAERGNRLARLVLRAKQAPDDFISGAQLGITMASLALGWVGEETFAHFVERALQPVPFFHGPGAVITAHSLAVLLAFAVITLLHIVLGEQVPKMLALQHAEGTVILSVQAMRVWERVFRPFIWLLSWLTNATLRLLGMRYQEEHAAAHSAEELKMLLHTSKALDATEQDIAERAVELGELAARQIMVPRTEVDSLPAHATLAELLEVSVRTSHQRFPVFVNTPDQIVGIAHVQDALQTALRVDGADRPPARNAGNAGNAGNGGAGGAGGAGGTSAGRLNGAGTIEERLARTRVDQLMREALIVPETLSVTGLIAEMRRRRQRVAVLVDEYGSTAGLVSWEDLLERLVGNVPDDQDGGQPEIQPEPGGSALVNGRTLIEDVNEHFNLHLEAEGYDTIGGFVFGRLGRKPDVGDVVEASGFRFRVEAMDGLRIATLRVEPVDPKQRGALMNDE